MKKAQIKCSLSLIFTLLALGSLIFSGCSENKSNSNVDPTLTDLYSKVFSQSCISCHVPGQSAYDLNGVTIDFTSKDLAYQTLVSKTVSGTSSTGTCGSAYEVVPGSETQSYLVAVLISSYSTDNFAGISGCTPYAGHHENSYLTDEAKSALVQWVQNGANND